MTLHAPIEAAETLDPDEAHEIAREAALEEFNDWRGRDWRNREFEDFGDWLTRMSQPHMVDHEKYARAMTYAERGADLLFLSKGQNKFNRDFARQRENRREGGSR